MVSCEPIRLGSAEMTAIDHDFIDLGVCTRAERLDLHAVHAHPARQDHLLGHPPRGYARVREDLL